MRFEEVYEIGQSLLSPELYMDLVPLNFKKVERAAPDDQPDNPVGIARGQLRQPFGGTSQDRFMGVLKGPLNGLATDHDMQESA